jgi:hypothetical protein
VRKLLVILLSIVIATAGCDAIRRTGDSRDDAESAQSLMPTFQGYTSIQTDNVQTAIANVISAGTLATGNPLGAAATARIDAMLTCYRDVGAVDARVFVSNSLENGLPVAGVLGIINQTRLVTNFLECAVDPGRGPRAQTAEPQPCTGTGNLVVNGESITYIYAASSQTLCTRFEEHFNTVRAQNQ